AQGTAEIAQNICSVAQAARSTAEGATSSLRAADELTRMAAVLQQLVSQFGAESNSGAVAPVAPSAQLEWQPAKPNASPFGGDGMERCPGHGSALAGVRA